MGFACDNFLFLFLFFPFFSVLNFISFFYFGGDGYLYHTLCKMCVFWPGCLKFDGMVLDSICYNITLHITCPLMKMVILVLWFVSSAFFFFVIDHKCHKLDIHIYIYIIYIYIYELINLYKLRMSVFFLFNTASGRFASWMFNVVCIYNHCIVHLPKTRDDWFVSTTVRRKYDNVHLIKIKSLLFWNH